MVLDTTVVGDDALVFADAAARAHLQVLWDVRQLQSWTNPTSVVAKLDAHPATYGFYVAEEPDSRAPVAAVCNLLGLRNHPRVGALFSYNGYEVSDRIPPLLGLAEIITCASYPVGVHAFANDPSLPLSSIGDLARKMSVAGARHNFVPAVTLQAFSWSLDPTEAPSPDFARWPTRNEMRTMRNQALSGGMQTLFWFSRGAVRRAYDPQARWADVCAAASGQS